VATIKLIKTIKEMHSFSSRERGLGKIISFVPTMGFLHEGHLSLMRIGKERSDTLVISIFVNPSQFGPGEDFEAYPRDLDKDLELIKQIGADAVFNPERDELCDERFQTHVQLEKLPDHLCGITRPVHFRGVATIVSKLFNIVKPHIALFGEKDFQQVAVIRQMVKDLNFDIDIVSAPTIREVDGLAMSSRNTYLNPEQRLSAISLYSCLQKAQELVNKGQKEVKIIVAAATELINSFPDTDIDYISICDPETLDSVNTVKGPTLMALAVNVGETRLIDNIILTT
jgi:pantoate--beta-alanine ligase